MARSKSITRSRIGVIILICGFGLGVAFQKWVTVGRVIRWLAPGHSTAQDIPRPAGLENDSTLCLLVAGQSNAASHGRPRGRAGEGVYALTAEGWFPAVDPFPGGSGFGGSVWTRLGPMLRHRSLTEQVVIGCVAQGSSSLSAWAPGGGLEPLYRRLGDRFEAERLEIDALIWHQGETESWRNDADSACYRENLERLIDAWQQRFPGVPIVICQTSRDPEGRVNPGIRGAQRAVCEREGVHVGPDTDALGDKFRHDQVHWNEAGMRVFAEELMTTLKDILQTGS